MMNKIIEGLGVTTRACKLMLFTFFLFFIFITSCYLKFEIPNDFNIPILLIGIFLFFLATICLIRLLGHDGPPIQEKEKDSILSFSHLLKTLLGSFALSIPTMMFLPMLIIFLFDYDIWSSGKATAFFQIVFVIVWFPVVHRFIK